MQKRHAALATYFVICAAALIYPGYALLGNRLEPSILGLPLSFAYNIGWVVVTFIVLASYHYATGEEG